MGDDLDPTSVKDGPREDCPVRHTFTSKEEKRCFILPNLDQIAVKEVSVELKGAEYLPMGARGLQVTGVCRENPYR